MTEQTALVVSNQASMFLAPVASLNAMLTAYQLKKDFVNHVLREHVDFGKIPGAGDKPALLKAGAEKFVNLYALAPTFEDVTIVEDWTGEKAGKPLFYYRQRCVLWRNMPDGTRILAGSADGSCSSWEKKYLYRNAERTCPNCGKPAIIKGKAEYGGGYVCFEKKGGCKAKFKDGDPAIEGQQLGQIINPDPAEVANTVLKMAQKRALIAAVLIVTGASDYFTQDIEDYIDGDYREQPAPAQPAKAGGNAKPTDPPTTDAWAKWRALVDVAATYGLPANEPVEPTTADLREAYGKLKGEIETARAAQQPQENNG